MNSSELVPSPTYRNSHKKRIYCLLTRNNLTNICVRFCAVYQLPSFAGHPRQVSVTERRLRFLSALLLHVTCDYRHPILQNQLCNNRWRKNYHNVPQGFVHATTLNPRPRSVKVQDLRSGPFPPSWGSSRLPWTLKKVSKQTKKNWEKLTSTGSFELPH